MQPRRKHEIIEAEPEEKGDQHQSETGGIEGKPEDIEIIQVRGNEPVQGRNFIENEHLDEDEQRETKDIFQQFTHWNFFRVESSSFLCSTSWLLAIT